MPITYALNQHAVESPTTLKGKGITEIVPILEVCGVKVDNSEMPAKCQVDSPVKLDMASLQLLLQ